MATTAEPQGANSQEAMNTPTTAKGWGTDAPDQPLRPMEFERRALRPNDRVGRDPRSRSTRR